MANEIRLNHLTVNEYVKHRSNSENDNFEQYKQAVILLFQIKDLYFFESDLLKEHSAKTMQEIIETNPDRFFPAGKRNKKNELSGSNDKKRKENPTSKNKVYDTNDFEMAWYDLWLPHFNITPKESSYDLFFVYQLRNLDLLDTDDFLTYQLETYFENDIAKFKRLVILSFRKHSAKLLLPEQIQTVQEWVAMIEATPEVSGIEKEERIKGRMQREAGDKLTSLTLVQTALLIEFMKEAKIILKSNTDLNYTQTGKAFNILTGYSAHTIRMQLGTKGALEGVKHEDYKELHEVILQLANLIEAKTHKK